MREFTLSDYADRYDHIRLQRTDGILLVQLHTDGHALRWELGPHLELGFCFADIAADPENEVVILTGTGDEFCADLSASSVDRHQSAVWDRVLTEGKRLLFNLLDIPVPMIAAVNGPALVHAELAVLCDIVLAADTAVFQDAPHFRFGVTPSDGVHVVWPLLLGPNRGRHFLLTGQQIGAEEARSLGVVAEVLRPDALLDRAYELARDIAKRPRLTRRYAREAMTLPIKRALHADLPYGLALEGLAAGDFWPRGATLDRAP
jgi:enoyl-CoA hydratase/carnithine racemase